MSRIKIILTVLKFTAVPVAAFLIRMAKGDTRNEDERIISSFIQDLIEKLIRKNKKEADP